MRDNRGNLKVFIQKKSAQANEELTFLMFVEPKEKIITSL